VGRAPGESRVERLREAGGRLAGGAAILVRVRLSAARDLTVQMSIS